MAVMGSVCKQTVVCSMENNQMLNNSKIIPLFINFIYLAEFVLFSKTPFFDVDHFLKSLLICYNIDSLLCFGIFLGPEACGIIYPSPEIEPTPPALESKVLTTGLPGKSHDRHCLKC